MKSFLKLFFISGLFTPFLCCSQSKKMTAGINGEYKFSDSLLLIGQSIVLNKDSSYYYKTGTDLETLHSYGRWSMIGDTILLTSSIRRNAIPVSIKEKRIDSIKGNLVISLVQNLDKEIMDAAFMFNGDTSKLCIPLLETGCDQKEGSIDSFRIGFSNKTYTPWLKIKDKRTNLLEVTAEIHDVLALYLFFTNEKFQYKNASLQHVGVDSDGTHFKGAILKKITTSNYQK